MANGRDPDGLISERGPEGSEFLRLIEERERLLKQLGGSEVFSDVVLSQIRQLRPDQAVAFLRKNRETPQNLRFAQPPRTMRFEGDRTRSVAQKARDLRQLLDVQESTAGGAARVSTRAPGGGAAQGIMPGLKQLLEAAVERERGMRQEMEEAGVKGGPGILGLLMPTPGGAAGAARGASGVLRSAPGEAGGELARRRTANRLGKLDEILGRITGQAGLRGPIENPRFSIENRILEDLVGIVRATAETDPVQRVRDQAIEELRRLIGSGNGGE